MFRKGSNFSPQKEAENSFSKRRHLKDTPYVSYLCTPSIISLMLTHLLVRDNGDCGVVGAHVVEHEVLGLLLHLLPSEHAVVERHRHRLAHQLQAVQAGQLHRLQQGPTLGLQVGIFAICFTGWF